MNETTTLPKMIEDRLAELEQSRIATLRLANAAGDLASAIEKFEALMPCTSVYDDHITLSIYVGSMKQAAGVLRALRKREFKVAAHTDHPDQNLRAYELKRGESDKITVYARLLSGANAKCRYVQVGVKEVPVMELRCDDSETTPTTDQPPF